MKLKIFTKLQKLILLSAMCSSFLATNASPLFRDKFIEAPAKIVLPDPLEAAGSDNVPMVHNNNYDMIMPDYYDEHPAASMQYQNFEKFFDPEMIDTNNEYKMEETQFVHSSPVRPPQPLSAEERRIRQKLDDYEEKRDKKQYLKLKKGSTKPRLGAAQWDQFDYDSYSYNPDKKYKKSFYG